MGGMKDLLVYSNLALGAIAGFMLGGIWGAILSFCIIGMLPSR